MLQQFPNPQALARATFDLIVDRATRTLEESDRFTMAISGGPAPRPLFEEFASERGIDRMPWHATHVFWCDERCVPLDDDRSNAGMAYNTFLNDVPMPDDHVHPVNGRFVPERAADDYRGVLAECFGDQLPRFDLVQLGLGNDGHTASLFPGAEALGERDRWAVATDAADPPRVTLTYPVLNNSKTVVFMVTEAEKAETVQKVLEGPHVPQELPAQGIAPAGGDLYWFLTEGAGSQLTGNG